eukprot:scaffold74300_cov56-Phaeocystis_antarctica.AAC.3
MKRLSLSSLAASAAPAREGRQDCAARVTRHLSGKEGRLRAEGTEDHPEVRDHATPSRRKDKMKSLENDQSSRVTHSGCVWAQR